MRLVQGAAGSETSYGDPLDAALTWQRDGAEWIHLVDLDAGRQDRSAHPFSTTIALRDIRLTTRYEESSLAGSLFSTLASVSERSSPSSTPRMRSSFSSISRGWHPGAETVTPPS